MKPAYRRLVPRPDGEIIYLIAITVLLGAATYVYRVPPALYIGFGVLAFAVFAVVAASSRDCAELTCRLLASVDKIRSLEAELETAKKRAAEREPSKTAADPSLSLRKLLKRLIRPIDGRSKS